jgi:hypothetical protein
MGEEGKIEELDGGTPDEFFEVDPKEDFGKADDADEDFTEVAEDDKDWGV